jgi:hypothetical protein
MPRIRQPFGHWRAGPDHAECILPKSYGRGLYLYPIRRPLQLMCERWGTGGLVGLTVGNVVLHPSSWIDLQFPGLGKTFRIRQGGYTEAVRTSTGYKFIGVSENGAE